jgi:hypothetical protein
LQSLATLLNFYEDMLADLERLFGQRRSTPQASL